MALADGDEVGDGLAGFGENGDQAMARGDDRGGIVFRGVAKILFGRAAGGIGGRQTALAGAEAGGEPRVSGPGGDGDDARDCAARCVWWGGFWDGWGWFGDTAAAAAEACGGEGCVWVDRHLWRWGFGATHRVILQGVRGGFEIGRSGMR